ncbi:PTS glucose transporter subunit IIA, partial [Staphylococcus saprophyticus]|uniref:PTS glucose transporter subunit IIA n=1 Tax=Staphylococcus saprophyticus TaxID=29385 RepID=UPI003704BD0E
MPPHPKILPPFHPTLKTIFPTNHPIPLQSHQPLQLLIHIPIHTLNFNPQPFQTFLQTHHRLHKPQLLIQIHLHYITTHPPTTLTP